METILTLFFAAQCHWSYPQALTFDTLKQEAPETLVQPQIEMFTDKFGKDQQEEYYNTALEKYNRLGHWASPDHGINLHCN